MGAAGGGCALGAEHKEAMDLPGRGARSQSSSDGQADLGGASGDPSLVPKTRTRTHTHTRAGTSEPMGRGARPSQPRPGSLRTEAPPGAPGSPVRLPFLQRGWPAGPLCPCGRQAVTFCSRTRQSAHTPGAGPGLLWVMSSWAAHLPPV